MNWFIWRPIYEGQATLSEIRNHYSLTDLVNLHSVLDMKADLQWMQAQEAKRKR